MDEFSCGSANSKVCIPLSKVCNGVQDGCPNREDEQNCFRLTTFETGVPWEIRKQFLWVKEFIKLVLKLESGRGL